jgi:hypothetical protein
MAFEEINDGSVLLPSMYMCDDAIPDVSGGV